MTPRFHVKYMFDQELKEYLWVAFDGYRRLLHYDHYPNGFKHKENAEQFCTWCKEQEQKRRK